MKPMKLPGKIDRRPIPIFRASAVPDLRPRWVLLFRPVSLVLLFVSIAVAFALLVWGKR